MSELSSVTVGDAVLYAPPPETPKLSVGISTGDSMRASATLSFASRNPRVF